MPNNATLIKAILYEAITYQKRIEKDQTVSADDIKLIKDVAMFYSNNHALYNKLVNINEAEKIPYDIEIRSWLFENNISHQKTGSVYGFCKEEDAMAFKLRWL